MSLESPASPTTSNSSSSREHNVMSSESPESPTNSSSSQSIDHYWVSTCKADTVIHSEHMQRFVHQLWEYQQSDYMTDFTITTQDTEAPAIRCHRLVLSAASPYFKALLESDTKETKSGSVHFGHTDNTTMSTVLAHMYCAHIDLADEDEHGDVTDILLLADYLDICSLRDHCVTYMQDTVAEQPLNSIKWHVFAQQYGKQQLSDTCFHVMLDNFQLLAAHNSLLAMPLPLLTHYVSSNDLSVYDENPVVQAVLNVMDADGKGDEDFSLVFPHLRFKYCTVGYLCDVLKHPCIASKEQYREEIMTAIFHPEHLRMRPRKKFEEMDYTLMTLSNNPVDLTDRHPFIHGVYVSKVRNWADWQTVDYITDGETKELFELCHDSSICVIPTGWCILSFEPTVNLPVAVFYNALSNFWHQAEFPNKPLAHHRPAYLDDYVYVYSAERHNTFGSLLRISTQSFHWTDLTDSLAHFAALDPIVVSYNPLIVAVPACKSLLVIGVTYTDRPSSDDDNDSDDIGDHVFDSDGGVKTSVIQEYGISLNHVSHHDTSAMPEFIVKSQAVASGSTVYFVHEYQCAAYEVSHRVWSTLARPAMPYHHPVLGLHRGAIWMSGWCNSHAHDGRHCDGLQDNICIYDMSADTWTYTDITLPFRKGAWSMLFLPARRTLDTPHRLRLG